MVTARKIGMTDYVMSNRLVMFNIRVGLSVLFWGLVISILALLAQSVMLR